MQYIALYVIEKTNKFIDLHKNSFSVCRVFSPQSTVLESPLLGESLVLRLSRHAATLPFFLDGTFLFPTSFSSCDVATSWKDWTADRFVWFRLPNGKFHPGEWSSILVLARPPKRKCCRPLWYAKFLNINCVHLTFMRGVDMGGGSDGSGDWELHLLSCRVRWGSATVIAGRI